MKFLKQFDVEVNHQFTYYIQILQRIAHRKLSLLRKYYKIISCHNTNLLYKF